MEDDVGVECPIESSMVCGGLDVIIAFPVIQKWIYVVDFMTVPG
jgi:hypothetical protein